MSATATTRADANRRAKQRQRERQASRGDRKLEIVVSATEYDLLLKLRELQRGPVEDFWKRALVTGACFTANSGTPRGSKVKRQGGDSGQKPPKADMSAGATE